MPPCRAQHNGRSRRESLHAFGIPPYSTTNPLYPHEDQHLHIRTGNRPSSLTLQVLLKLMSSWHPIAAPLADDSSSNRVGLPKPLDWNTQAASSNVCNWVGITCHRKSGTVREINLQGRGLRGVVDAAIWDLANLEVVNLSENELSGSVPAWPLAATRPLRSPLIVLNLKDNALVGPLPALEPFVNLRELAAAGNQLDGAIPAGLSKITGLQSLELGYVSHGRNPAPVQRVRVRAALSVN